MPLTVLVTLLFLMPLFKYTPDLILAAIIVTAVIGLIDYQSAFRLWKVDKLDFMACLSSFLGVLFVSVPVGLAIAVIFSSSLYKTLCLTIFYQHQILKSLWFFFSRKGFILVSDLTHLLINGLIRAFFIFRVNRVKPKIC
ncbi:putative SLC26A/SulP transporter [Helianthus annuus]|nr:putative SLC26A/SulP transporter [Helianthus annuus]KAJ0773570.1 putative SLC26A/SulP transporter [Helianthus annuus]